MRPALLCLLLAACTSGADPLGPTDAAPDTDVVIDTDSDTDGFTPWWDPDVDPFADRVVAFEPGPFHGFGEDELPDIVLGAPRGRGEIGSLHVLSLGEGGSITLAFDEHDIVDGPGPDLLVFENAFVGWVETGEVAVSPDGETWSTWPCDPDAEAFDGCAGVERVWAAPGNGIDPTDPDTAGGDAFDLADLGLGRARYVRITDTGANDYGLDTGGFDLDAVAIVNGERR